MFNVYSDMSTYMYTKKNTSFNKILLKYHNVDINHLSVVHVFMETDIAVMLIDI